MHLGGPTVQQAVGASAAGRLAWLQADYPAARRHLEVSLEAFNAMGERSSAVTVLGSLGQLATAEGEFARGRQLCERAVAEARALGDKRLLAGQLRACEIVLGSTADYAAASALDIEALELWRELGDRRGIAQALMGLGMVAAHTGDGLEARARLLESLDLSRELGESWLTCGALVGLGHAERALGNPAAAHAYYVQSLRHDHESKGNWNIHLLEAIAALAAAEGAAITAAQLLGASEAVRDARRFPMLPCLRVEHDRAVAAARMMLTPESFSAAWAKGRTMAHDDVFDLAVRRDEWTHTSSMVDLGDTRS